MSENIVIDLPDEAPIDRETLDARPLGDGRFEVLGIPFVTYDVCRGDRVRCEGEARVVTEVVHRAGHRTLRLLLDDALGGMDRMKLLLGLKQAGVVAAEPRGRYHALDVPPDADVQGALDQLETAAEAGHLEFELVDPGS